MTVFLEIPTLVADLLIAAGAEFSPVDRTLCREALGIHCPEYRQIAGINQSLAHRNIIRAPFRYAGLYMDYAKQSLRNAGSVSKQYICFIGHDV